MAQILVCLTGVYAVLAKLAALMRPDGGMPDRDSSASPPHDALVRPVYMRIARNFREAGPVGFRWRDVFGIPMRERFSNNTVTYLLHLRLGSRGTSLCGLILFALSVLAVVAAGCGAAAGTSHRIRYKHYPDFVARQGGARIPVAGYQPFDDAPERRFDSGPLGLGMWSPFRLWRSVAKRTMQPDRDPAAAPPAGDRAPLPHEDDRCPSTGAFPSSR